jgi:hypothetical protein
MGNHLVGASIAVHSVEKLKVGLADKLLAGCDY